MTTELFPFDADEPAESRRERHDEPRTGRARAGEDRAQDDEPGDEELEEEPDADPEQSAPDEHERGDDPAASDEVADERDEHDAAPAPAARDESGDGPWERYLPRLRERFPGPRDGTLFCVYKLEQDPDLSLKDFKAEAELRGIMLSGRSLHAAKVLLGMEAPPRPRRRAEHDDEEAEAPEHEDSPWEQPRTRSRAPAATTKLPAALSGLGGDLEATIRRAVDEAARDRTAKLREAMQQAIDVLRDALDAID